MQSFKGVLRKRCCENIQQIYRRSPMLKCDFNKVAKQLNWNRILAWVFSCKFVTYFQKNFSKEQLWRAASSSELSLQAGWHCVKNVRIRSFSGPYFPAFRLNMGRYSVSLRIKSKCGKIWTRKFPSRNTFYAVWLSLTFSCKRQHSLGVWWLSAKLKWGRMSECKKVIYKEGDL